MINAKTKEDYLKGELTTQHILKQVNILVFLVYLAFLHLTNTLSSGVGGGTACSPMVHINK